ncbi:thiamine diphosphokinase [Paenibacillus antibioticophila]|uniref:thiamine diphosphokinase n=1 Tax=Paenibacillus antibioticophila TaxID=1274374 RepID=UPI0005CABAC9|nr:thiamine diphosphokinase [Paenibacillus antibioticophila]
MEEKRVYIFAGGQIDPSCLEQIAFTETDMIIGADRGALFLIQHGLSPDIAVGDFDSVSPEELDLITANSKQFISCDAIDKDLTDTELAFDLAIDNKATEVTMLGVLGTRFDHSLANVHIMMRGLQHQITSSIWDANNYITLTGTSCELEERGYTYVSLLPLTTEVTGITLKGFMYPLENATIKMGQSLGVSNRLTHGRGVIRIDSGLLLIIQSKD